MEYLGYQELLVLSIILVIGLVIGIFFLLTLQNTLKAIEPLNRSMEPGIVWVLLIPFVNIILVFLVINAIATSGKKQLEQYGEYSSEKPTFNVGIGWAICSLCNWVPLIDTVTGIASLVLFIFYWVKVNELRKQLLLLKQVYENRDDGSIL